MEHDNCRTTAAANARSPLTTAWYADPDSYFPKMMARQAEYRERHADE